MLFKVTEKPAPEVGYPPYRHKNFYLKVSSKTSREERMGSLMETELWMSLIYPDRQSAGREIKPPGLA